MSRNKTVRCVFNSLTSAFTLDCDDCGMKGVICVPRSVGIARLTDIILNIIKQKESLEALASSSFPPSLPWPFSSPLLQQKF